MTSQLHTFADGEFTITVRTTLQPNGEYTAVDDNTYDCDCDQDGYFSTSPVGYGLSTLGAIADLFEKLPRAESDREERDDRAARFDHAQDHRKNWVA